MGLHGLAPKNLQGDAATDGGARRAPYLFVTLDFLWMV
jgi:hypothetical protein